MAVRKIIEIGHKSLKLKNKRVSDFHSPKLKQLIKDLIDTMKQVDLIGIAAPQIGENYQVFITKPRKTQYRRLPQGDKLRFYINPKITYYSRGKNTIYEGCGCLPNASIFGPVLRSKEITIQAYDKNGKKFTLTCDGILARVIQHEYDHLQGIEFLERITDNKKLVGEQYFYRYIRNSKAQLEESKITKIIKKSL